MKKLLNIAIEAAVLAGVEILKIYDSDFAVEQKEDRSPLTLADKNAHDTIVAYLEKTGIPILSEEGKEINYSERSPWAKFWMVDPLDGTKEFVKRNGEFTVNIALIENGKATMGVIYVPVKQVLYFSTEEEGAFKVTEVSAAEGFDMEHIDCNARKMPQPVNKEAYTIVGSRSHMSVETEEFIREKESEHGKIDIVSMGSSLKICLVAEGVADVYPRFAPTMEWDTAAGHAIANGAGKEVLDMETKSPMRYNKENLLNNWFLVE